MSDEQQSQPKPKRSSPRRKGLQIDAPGFEADIVALAGDPMTTIDAVRTVKFVMKGGRVYKR